MKFFYLIICLLVHGVMSSQVQVNSILLSSENDLEYKNKISLIEKTNDLSFNSWWLKGMEARVGFAGSTYRDTIYGYLRNEDNFELILSVNNFREIRKQQEYKKYFQEKLKAESDGAFEMAQKKRYQLIIDNLFIRQEISQLSNLDQLLIKKQSILRKLIESRLDFNLKDVLDVEKAKASNTFKISELNKSLHDLLRYWSTLLKLNSDFTIDSSQFISIEQIKDQLLKWTSNLSQEYGSEFELKQAEFNLTKANLSYVQSLNKQIFEGLRVSYDNPLYLTRPKNFNAQKNFSLKGVFTLPMGANNNLKKSELIISKLEKEQAFELLKVEAISKRNQYFQSMNELISEYDALQKLYQNSLVRQLLLNPLSKSQLESLEWYDLQIRFEENNLTMIDISKKIYTEYINYLQWSGRLVNQPRINYLSSKLETY